MKKLKERWGINSNFQLVLILIVFSINGSLAVWLASPILEFVGLHKSETQPLIYWPLRILIVFIVYQITLPLVGFCFGQLSFFKKFSGKTIGFLIGKKKALES